MPQSKQRPTADRLGSNGLAARSSKFFEQTLTQYRDLTTRALLEVIPSDGPSYLYDLVSIYPQRLGKGLRAALCFAICNALGGSERKALNSAVAVELFHNAFLIHDDVQDASELRRGGPTLHREYGLGIGVNVGNATNLIALHRLMANRQILGAAATWRVMRETEAMLKQSLEGQAIELGWIRDNVCDLDTKDYLQMCLKKTAWYSFIYPLRVGALIAEGRDLEPARFCSFGWYLGAAFQIQDDILNLTGSYANYRKEIAGDLWEGKRTLMLIHLLRNCTPTQRQAMEKFLATPRGKRQRADVEWLYQLMICSDSINFARRAARQLAGAAFMEALTALATVPDSDAKRFILEMILYVVRRDR
ncbi:MAG: polyprenyl synthetase family protein [Acidobacteriota bacterium]|nr:polyprenyl synthetase family protein [Acidobacteriota bacterium]